MIDRNLVITLCKELSQLYQIEKVSTDLKKEISKMIESSNSIDDISSTICEISPTSEIGTKHFKKIMHLLYEEDLQ